LLDADPSPDVGSAVRLARLMTMPEALYLPVDGGVDWQVQEDD
jgi:hypothetical protein